MKLVASNFCSHNIISVARSGTQGLLCMHVPNADGATQLDIAQTPG